MSRPTYKTKTACQRSVVTEITGGNRPGAPPFPL